MILITGIALGALAGMFIVEGWRYIQRGKERRQLKYERDLELMREQIKREVMVELDLDPADFEDDEEKDDERMDRT